MNTFVTYAKIITKITHLYQKSNMPKKGQWADDHPIIGFHVDRETKNRMLNKLNGRSAAELMRTLLMKWLDE